MNQQFYKCNMKMLKIFCNLNNKQQDLICNSCMIIRSSSGKVKIKAETIIITVYLFLFFVSSVYAQDMTPKLKPNCDHLETSQCVKTYSKDKHGKEDFKYYVEECSYHICTSISPPKPPPPPPYSSNVHWVPPTPSSFKELEEDFLEDKARAYFSKISTHPSKFQTSSSVSHNKSYSFRQTNIQNMSRQAYNQPQSLFKEGKQVSLHQNMSRYWDPKLVGVDSEGRFVREVTEPWFCSGYGPPVNGEIHEGVDYNARVTTNTQRSLGLTEDLKAHCEFLRFMDFIFMSSCDVLFSKCTECLYAYRAFMCAMQFPMCRPAPGNIYITGKSSINSQANKVIYAPNNLPVDVKINASYIIVKPCRGLCFGVQTGCPMSTQVQCHVKESRDFADGPHCNSVGSVNGLQPYN